MNIQEHTMREKKFGYTIKELSEFGPVKRSKLYEAINAGQLTARKHGRSTIVLTVDYENFLDQLPKVK
jgi:hypothetical protein